MGRLRILTYVAVVAILGLTNGLTFAALNVRYDVGYYGRMSSDTAQFDPLSIDDMLAYAGADTGPKVFWLGDSIVHSAGVDGALPDVLQRELQQRYGADVHVYNAAMDGSRSGDKYGVLRRALDTKPSLVILELKYNEFSRAQVEGLPFRYPYLNDAAATDLDYGAHYKEFGVALRPPTSDLALRADRTLDRAIPIVRFRGLIQEALFGGDLFARLAGGAADPPIRTVSRSLSRSLWPAARSVAVAPPGTQETNPAGSIYANFAPAYTSGPFDAFPNASLYFLRRIASDLDGSGIPAIVYFSSLDQGLLDGLMETDEFRSNVSLVDGIAAGHSFAYANYVRALPDLDFLDTEHLTTIGRREFVARILNDHASTFDRALRH